MLPPTHNTFSFSLPSPLSCAHETARTIKIGSLCCDNDKPNRPGAGRLAALLVPALMGLFVEMGSLGPVATVVPVRLKSPYEVCSGVAVRGVGGMTYVGLYENM